MRRSLAPYNVVHRELRDHAMVHSQPCSACNRRRPCSRPPRLLSPIRTVCESRSTPRSAPAGLQVAPPFAPREIRCTKPEHRHFNLIRKKLNACPPRWGGGGRSDGSADSPPSSNVRRRAVFHIKVIAHELPVAARINRRSPRRNAANRPPGTSGSSSDRPAVKFPQRVTATQRITSLA